MVENLGLKPLYSIANRYHMCSFLKFQFVGLTLVYPYNTHKNYFQAVKNIGKGKKIILIFCTVLHFNHIFFNLVIFWEF